MGRDMAVACLLRLDLHCQMFGGGPVQSIYTSIYILQAPPPAVDSYSLFSRL